MCGIAGYFGLSERPVAVREAMLAALRQRGPDSQHAVGFGPSGQRLAEPGAAPNALLHARLSIMDPRPEADQPMASPDGQVWLCYNGEVYGWHDDRAALERQGIPFRTHSDTEFILNGYLAWGLEGLLPRLRGMFAFCLVDWRLGKVWLVRDRLGLKPLLYTHDGESLAFASLLRALLPSLDAAPRLNPDSLDAFLAHRYVPAPLTIFDGVHRLENGHYLEFDLGSRKLRKVCYWTPHAHSHGAWEEVLDEAIRIRTHADRPMGLFLSGGIDSSTVACRLAEMGMSSFRTFSASFPGTRFDESDLAAQIAGRLGFPNTAVPIDPERLPDFERLIADLDEPFADPSSMPTWRLSEAVSREVKVVLGGDGGDELLAGYKRIDQHLRHAWRGDARLPLPTPAGVAKRGWRKWVGELGIGWRDAYALRFSGFAPHQRAWLQPGRRIERPHYWRLPEAADRSPRETLLAIDMLNYLPEYILRKGDLCTMAHGLELRAPLLDHKLVETLMALPPEQRFTRPAKRLFASVSTPLESLQLFDRPKKGFNPPLERWLAAELAPRLPGLGERLASSTGGQLERARVDAMTDAYRARQVPAEQLMQLVMLDESLRQLREAGGGGEK
ncbi:asparagine synthase (glutamine-hydrolyzing) [Crenobacter cavernae]|uniref:asparagine synthase (glutamine-hydrolyzing) n=1 Tax=Crenobacter cavernae TaxID=2290923 RepID=A0A345Y5S4_9NEIS|nr:asparagine synthase (glutamine-hydrolyzing) [Crenobacter cavernae]AXK39276.1 asparagine synthase (glutamine-hydrolyzing) [Crenobacter cavernae]